MSKTSNVSLNELQCMLCKWTHNLVEIRVANYFTSGRFCPMYDSFSRRSTFFFIRTNKMLTLCNPVSLTDTQNRSDDTPGEEEMANGDKG